MTSIGVIGCGAWATTAAKILAENGHSITQWCHRMEYVTAIQSFRENSLALPGIPLPASIQATLDPNTLAHTDVWVICLPSKHLHSLHQFQSAYRGQPAVSLIKGIPDQAQSTMGSRYIEQILQCRNLAVLSGPNLASELAHQRPGAAVVAAPTIEAATMIQRLFSGPYFRLYTSLDRIGVELGGVLKNVYAIAAGIADGLGLGTNAKSALMTRSLSEMVRIGTSFEGLPSTFYGLSGIGDLMATAYSTASRNWQYGNALGNGQPAYRNDRGVIEGARTAELLRPQLATLDVPIFTGISQIIMDGVSPNTVITSLMARELKSE